MKAQCPKCQAVYQIDGAKLPKTGRHGRCSQCGHRFFIRPEEPPRPSPPSLSAGQPAPVKKTRVFRPAAEKPAPPKPSDLSQTKYQRLYTYLLGYYSRKDKDFRYHFSAFSFAHRTIDSGEYIKNEVAKLRSLIGKNQKDLLGLCPDDKAIGETIKSENRRYGDMIKIFKDLVEIRDHFLKKGLTATYNEIFTVLKDVDLAHVRR